MLNEETGSIAGKDEIFEYLTGVMRNSEAGIKERLTACVQLGKYLGLEDRKTSELPKVVICDEYKNDMLQ